MPPKHRASLDNSRVYVLDTNVLLHDPAALFAFQEHDIYLPMVVLEELDRHKKGVADLAVHARQVTRSLDLLLPAGSMAEGFDLTAASRGRASGRLHFHDIAEGAASPGGLDVGKADNIILAVAGLLNKEGCNAILVTKDINLRVKALANGIPAQDYRSDRVFTDSDVLPTGITLAGPELWESAGELQYRKGPHHCIRIGRQLPVNSFVVEKTTADRTRLWRVSAAGEGESTLKQVHRTATGEAPLLSARNEEQTMALDLLHDVEVDAVALLGSAGTGKTLMALAAGLDQVRSGRYTGVLLTRATVPLGGEDIGFLPGNEEEKMGPWMGAVDDCYEVLKPSEDLKSKVRIHSMSFMRGRSFLGKYIIVDEAQNLTIPQMRALLTRVGEGSKVVVTGNLAQIDTPYLDEGSSGLAWAVKTLQDWRHAGHLILPRGERSRLATYIEEAASRSRDAEQKE